MFKDQYNIVGVMSGTSLDGIDLAHIIFTLKEQKWSFEIIEAETITYNSNWITELKKAINYSSDQLIILNQEYTMLLGKMISDFIKKNNIKNIDAVCSHGHTILHQPQNRFTLQIGNLPDIASICNQNVICDFRVQDVQFGGQGAPLVPIGDRILFSEYNYCLNLGGFSNVSFEENESRIAFDISPVNTVLNFYANSLGLEYDDKGAISKTGLLNLDLYDELNHLTYYKKSYPKSLGLEFVQEKILPLVEKYTIPTPDKMHTFIEHIAIQTCLALDLKIGKMLITGGGVYNEYLIERIKFYLPNMQIIIPEKKIVEYKEALIFGLLGVLKLRNEINVLSSVTGAKVDHSSGKVYLIN
ncbi:MAG: anhydro-N-acetylmuramic acid kinase [Flavobacterium sp.]|nr:anhydro-N-acetylmuramic acid kinase [Flavobacterium sp.]